MKIYILSTTWQTCTLVSGCGWVGTSFGPNRSQLIATVSTTGSNRLSAVLVWSIQNLVGVRTGRGLVAAKKGKKTGPDQTLKHYLCVCTFRQPRHGALLASRAVECCTKLRLDSSSLRRVIAPSVNLVGGHLPPG